MNFVCIYEYDSLEKSPSLEQTYRLTLSKRREAAFVCVLSAPADQFCTILAVFEFNASLLYLFCPGSVLPMYCLL
jgi:hypothetical protein